VVGVSVGVVEVGASVVVVEDSVVAESVEEVVATTVPQKALKSGRVGGVEEGKGRNVRKKSGNASNRREKATPRNERGRWREGGERTVDGGLSGGGEGVGGEGLPAGVAGGQVGLESSIADASLVSCVGGISRAGLRVVESQQGREKGEGARSSGVGFAGGVCPRKRRGRGVGSCERVGGKGVEGEGVKHTPRDANQAAQSAVQSPGIPVERVCCSVLTVVAS
jgi:hypothetical protein